MTSRLCFTRPSNSQKVVISSLSIVLARATATAPAVAIRLSPLCSLCCIFIPFIASTFLRLYTSLFLRASPICAGLALLATLHEFFASHIFLHCFRYLAHMSAYSRCSLHPEALRRLYPSLFQYIA